MACGVVAVRERERECVCVCVCVCEGRMAQGRSGGWNPGLHVLPWSAAHLAASSTVILPLPPACSMTSDAPSLHRHAAASKLCCGASP